MISPDSQLLEESVLPLRLIARERIRQEEMKRSGRFQFTCADDELSNAEKMTILMEEVGEVAREVLTQEGRRLARDTIGTREALQKELIQVAAVSLAWIESLE